MRNIHKVPVCSYLLAFSPASLIVLTRPSSCFSFSQITPRDIASKHISQHRAISPAQVRALGSIKSLVAPNHGPLLSAPFKFGCIFPCAGIANGGSRPRSRALVVHLYRVPGTWCQVPEFTKYISYPGSVQSVIVRFIGGVDRVLNTW